MRNKNIIIGSLMLMIVTFVGAFLLGRSTSSTSPLDSVVQFISRTTPEDVIEKNIKLFLKSEKACQNSLSNINPEGEGEEFNMIRDLDQNVIYQKGSLYNEVKIVSMKVHNFKSNGDDKKGSAMVTLILEKGATLSERSFELKNVELENAHGRLIRCQNN